MDSGPTRNHSGVRDKETKASVKAHVTLVRGFKHHGTCLSIYSRETLRGHGRTQPFALMCRVYAHGGQGPRRPLWLGQAQISQRGRSRTQQFQNFDLHIGTRLGRIRGKECSDGAQLFIHQDQSMGKRMSQVEVLQPFESLFIINVRNRPSRPRVSLKGKAKYSGSNPEVCAGCLANHICHEKCS
ncbi:hypothetical protein ASF74_18090 [Arthrobacter sp. Leaf145]|nr:hypothetical protein ASF74_18090 [Arthrobacter sp. Leaf145]